jgi:D-3-phosphoglycerate dehydrogenase
MLKDFRVLVTPTTYGKDDPRLRTILEAEVGEVIYNQTGRPLSSAELLPLIRGVDGIIAGLDRIDDAVIAAADRLKVISRYGVGVDSIDLEAARQRGIVVTHTPGANSASVAELTIALILSLARNIPQAVFETKSGCWPRLSGLSLEGKTVGLIGLGAIGRQVARRLGGFDCRIIAFDPWVDEKTGNEFGVQMVALDDLVSQSDFISLQCPLNEDTRGMVDSAFLNKVKPGTFLINTARGELVDEIALCEAVQTGRVRGAALDVLAEQPPRPDNPLLVLPQVLVTPHMGSHTDSAMNAMGWQALENCLTVLRGKEPLHRVL